MKVFDLTKRINDHGTSPRVRVYKHLDNGLLLVYDGVPSGVSLEVGNLSVRTFTLHRDSCLWILLYSVFPATEVTTAHIIYRRVCL